MLPHNILAIHQFKCFVLAIAFLEFNMCDPIWFHSFTTVLDRTINSVASGPSGTESKNQMKPLRPLPCASPALMRQSVPHPTKKSVVIAMPIFTLRYGANWLVEYS